MAKGILNTQLPGSNLGLKEETPDLRAGAEAPTGLHVDTKSKLQKAEHSTHDLDGATPDKYLDNKPG